VALATEVWWVDRFGKLPAQHRTRRPRGRRRDTRRPPGGALRRAAKAARWVQAYAEARPSELVVLVDSYGLVALALDRRSAAAEYGLAAGSPVLVLPPGATVPP